MIFEDIFNFLLVYIIFLSGFSAGTVISSKTQGNNFLRIFCKNINLSNNADYRTAKQLSVVLIVLMAFPISVSHSSERPGMPNTWVQSGDSQCPEPLLQHCSGSVQAHHRHGGAWVLWTPPLPMGFLCTAPLIHRAHVHFAPQHSHCLHEQNYGEDVWTKHRHLETTGMVTDCDYAWVSGLVSMVNGQSLLVYVGMPVFSFVPSEPLPS